MTDQASEPGLIQRNTLSYTAHYDGKKTGRRYRELVFSTQVCYQVIVRPQEKLLPSSGPQFSQRLRSLITSGKVQVHHFVWRKHIFFFSAHFGNMNQPKMFQQFPKFVSSPCQSMDSIGAVGSGQGQIKL